MLSGIKNIYLEIYSGISNVLKKNEKPENLLMKYVRDIIRQLNIFSDAITLKNPLSLIRTISAIGLIFIFWGTIIINLMNCFEDVVAFGENIMFASGASVILFKTIVFAQQWKRINVIISIFVKLNKRSSDLKNQQIQEIQRLFFIREAGLFLLFSAMGLFLCTTISVQPIFTGQSIPLPAWFPFNMQDSEKYPWSSKLVYSFQVFTLCFAMLVLLPMENAGICCISQTSMNLRILSVRLRQLGVYANDDHKQNENLWSELWELVELHQIIIRLADEINDAFYIAYLVQIFSSTFMLGTASFEALLALNDVMVAFQFFTFIFIAVTQLAYWCMIGNMAYFDSQEVAVAAFEVHDWFEQSPALQRNLMFLIQRAQKPLQFPGRPFLPFTMETFMQILRVSYTAFTVLYNSSEYNKN